MNTTQTDELKRQASIEAMLGATTADAGQNRDQNLADELLRDLADGKGWDEERWAKRGIAQGKPELPKALRIDAEGMIWQGVKFIGWSESFVDGMSAQLAKVMGQVETAQTIAQDEHKGRTEARNHADKLAEALREIATVEANEPEEKQTVSYEIAKQALADWEKAKQ